MQYPVQEEWLLTGEECAGCPLRSRVCSPTCTWWRLAWRLVLRLAELVAEEVNHDE